MNLSNLQHIIREKELELARIRQAEVDATMKQEEEARDQMLQALESMKYEVERTRKESDLSIKTAIQQAEVEAAVTIEQARIEMSEALRFREEEIFVAARMKMENEWKSREDRFQEELNEVLSSELKSQRNELTSHYSATIADLIRTMEANEEKVAHKFNEMKTRHQCHMEEMHQKMEEAADTIWSDACEKISAEAEAAVSNRLKIAEEQCNMRDEQISVLLDERVLMQKLLCEKEDQF